MNEIIEPIIAILSVIGLMWAGAKVGREYGTWEIFALFILNKLIDSLEKRG